MKIQHNLLAMNANRNIKINTGIFAKTSEKLASGYQINRAADDAAGLSISEKMRKMIRGLERASQNCQDGISMVQTAEGALSEVHAMLQRMNELAVQSANGTNSESDREALQQEFAQIQEEIDRVSTTTKFNELKLFTGNVNGAGGTGGTGGTGGAGGTSTPTVTVGAYTISGGTENVDFSYDTNTGTLTILSNKDITIEGIGNPTADKIVIQDGVTANVTLKNVNIDVSATDGACAFDVDGNATLNLTLEGNNILKSGKNKAGLQVESGASVNIMGGSGDTLNATGGYYGAGIGGGSRKAGGDITISGGEVTATGGNSGAGIGGGEGKDGGTITISGGNVTATGGVNGAGIGGGTDGAGGDITISGGNVTATGSHYGAGIGGGDMGDAGTFSTGSNGNATITATGGDGYLRSPIADTSNQANWSGTINGVTYPLPTPVPCGDFMVTGGVKDVDFSYDEAHGVLSVLTDKDITIKGTGAVSGDVISIEPGVNANLTLENVNIDVSHKEWACAFNINDTASLNLTLTGTNTLKSGENCAGLQVCEGASLVITEQSAGSLTAVGSSYGAGIGSAYGEDSGNITINGGDITATGGYAGAGIGGSGYAGAHGAGGTITINGGNVTATGGEKGAGIGGGSGGTGGDITITDGDITATGSNGGAGIGGGRLAAAGDITITGGVITATGNDTVAIGKGKNGGDEGNIIIGGGVINGATPGNLTTNSIQTMSLNRMARATGSTQNVVWIQAGADAGVGLNIEIGAMDTKVLGIEKDIVNILTEDASTDAITAVGEAIQKLSEQRSRLGAYQNRLEHTIANLDNVVENTTAAESRIRDADMAELMVEYSSYNIILQAAQSMLAQANHQPEGVEQLLQ